MLNNKNLETRTRVPNIIKKLADTVTNQLDSLYTKTYFTSPSSRNDLDITKANINKTIDTIIGNSSSETGINISSLYTRLEILQNDSSTIKKTEEIFTDRSLMSGLMSSVMQNTWAKEYDREIDTVLKYCPKLKEALEVRKDNVLSADHFNKDYIYISDEYNVKDNVQATKRYAEIKEKYNLLEEAENWYNMAATYGECFVYTVPYDRAIAKLLAIKNKNFMNPVNTIQEAAIPFNTVAISEAVLDEIANIESGDLSLLIESTTISSKGSDFSKNPTNKFNFNVEFNMTGMLYENIITYTRALRQKKIISEMALSEDVKSDNSIAVNNKSIKKTRGIDKNFIDKDSKLDYKVFETDTTSNDGLIDKNTIRTDEEKIKLRVSGAVNKILDRYNVLPIYIDNLCLGAYYFEFKENAEAYNINSRLSDPIMTLKANTKLYHDTEEDQRNQVMKYISAKLSAAIDAKFINMNQDLTKEIYMILKHNDKFNDPAPDGVRVTFIPPEDFEHIYFRKDPITQRGISDLESAMLPAKLYSGLYITNTIAAMTRAQDRRVYYVKQAVDTNISAVLLNVINQIKQSNFNIRQIENINNTLNIIGRFNDFVIPTGPNGDSPVQFEVMQGQNVDPQSELMQKLEEMAVNAVDVPLELIQARQSIDYAVQFTMSNTKFLRKVFNRQARFQPFLSRIFTKLYNAEYHENAAIKVSLPPPAFLSITNTDQLSNNIVNLAATIADTVIPEDQNDPDNQLARSMITTEIRKDYLKSFIDFSKADQLKDKVLQKIKLMKEANPPQE